MLGQLAAEAADGGQAEADGFLLLFLREFVGERGHARRDLVLLAHDPFLVLLHLRAPTPR